jgi:ABC-type uncharacterized transport system permease subunit
MLAIIIVSAILYLVWAFTKAPFKYKNLMVYMAWVLHAFICFYSLIDEHGWKLNIMNAVLMVTWLSVFIVLLFKIDSIWVKVPLVFFVVISLLMVDINPILEHHHYHAFSWQMVLHVTLSILSYSTLSVATLYAVSLWVHIKRIKNSEFDTKTGLISLIDEEIKLFKIIVLGWLILTTSLISGVLYIDDFIQQQIGHKVVFSILAWLIFGSIIIGRLNRGWRGEKLILLTITGMSMLATGYLGSKIVLEWIIN